MKKETNYSKELIQARNREAMHKRINEIKEEDNYFFLHDKNIEQSTGELFVSMGINDPIRASEMIVTMIKAARLPIALIITTYASHSPHTKYVVDLSKETVDEAKKAAYDIYKNGKA